MPRNLASGRIPSCEERPLRGATVERALPCVILTNVRLGASAAPPRVALRDGAVLTRFSRHFLVLGVLASSLAPRPVTAAEADPGPPLDEPVAKLSAAFVCPAGLHHPEHRPVLLAPGTSATVQHNSGCTYIPPLNP